MWLKRLIALIKTIGPEAFVAVATTVGSLFVLSYFENHDFKAILLALLGLWSYLLFAFLCKRFLTSDRRKM